MSIRTTIVAAALVVIGVAGRASADSLIKEHAPNGLFMQTSVTAGYVPLGSTSTNDQVVVDPTGFDVITTLSVSVDQPAPFSTEPKDSATGTAMAVFEFGTPFPGASLSQDRLTLSLDGSASAVDAHNGEGGFNLDSRVSASILVTFFLDVSFGGPGFVGTLDLPALRSLDPFETFLKLTVMQESLTIGSQNPGDGPLSIDLTAGHLYSINLSYQMDVPFGSDPPFHVELPLDLTLPIGVPEPASLAVLGSAMVLMTTRRRGRR